MRVSIQRPWVWLGMAATTFAAGIAAAASLIAILVQSPPAVVVDHKAELADALEAAPWFAWKPGNPDDPAVYVLSHPRCPSCRALEQRLSRWDATELRVIVVAPRDAGELETAVAAELARRRSGDAFRQWLQHPAQPLPIAAGVQEVDTGPDAMAGYAEYGRAAFDRLSVIAAANGVALQAPALIWRRGLEWRIAVEPDGWDLQALARDLAAAG